MAKVKKVGFNFFRPLINTHTGDERLFTFSHILEDIRNEYLKARDRISKGIGPKEYKLIYRYNDEPARLADVSVDYETGYYHLVFERLDYQVPNRTTLHGESEALDLQDDEYIGIDVNVLYDPHNNIFMIQRNRSSLGPSGIELFLRTIISEYHHDFNDEFHLAIVSDEQAKRRAFNQSAYRKVHVKVAGLKANGLVEKLSSKNGVAGGVGTVEITFNSDTPRNAKMDEDFAKSILENFIDDPEVLKLQIRAKENENSVVEPIDLIDHKLQTFIEFDFRTDRQLNPITAFDKMIKRYDIENGGFKNKVLRA